MGFLFGNNGFLENSFHSIFKSKHPSVYILSSVGGILFIQWIIYKWGVSNGQKQASTLMPKKEKLSVRENNENSSTNQKDYHQDEKIYQLEMLEKTSHNVNHYDDDNESDVDVTSQEDEELTKEEEKERDGSKTMQQQTNHPMKKNNKINVSYTSRAETFTTTSNNNTKINNKNNNTSACMKSQANHTSSVSPACTRSSVATSNLSSLKKKSLSLNSSVSFSSSASSSSHLPNSTPMSNTSSCGSTNNTNTFTPLNNNNTNHNSNSLNKNSVQLNHHHSNHFHPSLHYAHLQSLHQNHQKALSSDISNITSQSMTPMSLSSSEELSQVERLTASLEAIEQERVSLKDTIFYLKSSNKKLETQVRQLSKKKFALQESIKILKRDLWSEKQARFVTENTLNEKVKKLEMELDFKETELEELQQKFHDKQNNPLHSMMLGVDDVDDDEDWLYEIPPNTPMPRLESFILETQVNSNQSVSGSPESDFVPDLKHNDSSFLTPPPSSCAPTSILDAVDISQLFSNEAKKHVYHHFVCNVSSASIIVDLDDLMMKYNVSNDDCVQVAFDCLLDYIENKHQQTDATEQIPVIIGKYAKVVLNFLEDEFPKQKLLDELLQWSLERTSRKNSFFPIVLNLYREELLDVDELLDWFDKQKSNSAKDQAKFILQKCDSFITWLKKKNEESSSAEEDDDLNEDQKQEENEERNSDYKEETETNEKMNNYRKSPLSHEVQSDSILNLSSENKSSVQSTTNNEPSKKLSNGRNRRRRRRHNKKKKEKKVVSFATESSSSVQQDSIVNNDRECSSSLSSTATASSDEDDDDELDSSSYTDSLADSKEMCPAEFTKS